MKTKQKILFLLKKNGGYDTYQTVAKSGLLNSAQMVVDQLNHNLNVECKIAICVDGNSIDKELHAFKPAICILEAIWVTPDKLKELVRLHPHVQFIVRVHSELPFLANEGNAIDWIKQFSEIKNVRVAFNSSKTFRDFTKMFNGHYLYLPNIYEDIKKDSYRITRGNLIDIGCFGAIRPMKNQLIQASAAIIFANKNNMHLRFHVNSSRLEQGGNSVLKNLIALFKNTKHELIQHDWMDRKKFLEVISQMDIGMQVSFSESFNIVTADFVAKRIPIVVSSSISWMPFDAVAYVNSTKDIVEHLEDIRKYPAHHILGNLQNLIKYNFRTLKTWKKFIDND